jgi:hypothetical protein
MMGMGGDKPGMVRGRRMIPSKITDSRVVTSTRIVPKNPG